MKSKKIFVYSDRFSKYDYGASHPLKLIRLKYTYELMESFSLFDLEDVEVVEPEAAPLEEVLKIHSEEYINALKLAEQGKCKDLYRWNLGWGDNPVFFGMYEGSLLSAGASLLAAKLVAECKANISFNIAGGLHHAKRDKASGFCYLNDPAIAIAKLVEMGFTVAYIDIDAHHGDGVQEFFYNTNKVLTISLHESGYYLFPGTGFLKELGEGEGKGYSINIPLNPGTDDEVYIMAFSEIVPDLVEKFDPDIIFTQLGVDTFYSDPLTHLCLTTRGFCEVIKIIKSFKRKWVAVGGGGYNIFNVIRAWTLAWAIMNDIELPKEIPENFIKSHPEIEFPSNKLYDEKINIDPKVKEEAKEEVIKAISYLKKHVPLLNE